MRRIRPLLLACAALAALAVVPAPARAASGQIRVFVRNDFSTALSGATVIYSCGSGEQTVTDQSGTDLDADVGTILIAPAAPASCDIGDELTIQVSNLGAAGYLNWLTQTIFDTNRENAFTTQNRFSVLVRLTDEFGSTPLTSTGAAGSFSGGASVGGVLSPDHSQLGFAVPVGGNDGTLSVTGLGALGYLNTTQQNISVPPTPDASQRVYVSRSQYSILVLGRDQFGQTLLGSGGNALFQSSSQISCPNQSGTALYGCPVPVGTGASTVHTTRPGYADYASGAVAPPATAGGVQTAVQTANLFAIKVLGIANEFGGAVTPTSTPDVNPPFLASGTNVIGMRWSASEWYIAATPGSVQLTAQVNGYANTAVRVEVSSAGQAVVDYDGPTGATWGATVDGPAVPTDMYVTLYDTAGAAVPGAQVTIYMNADYSGNHVATDLRGSGTGNATRLTESDGTAKFALPTGTYWVQIVKGGVTSWGSSGSPKSIGYIESGGPYRYTLNLATGTGETTGRGSGQAAVSAARSTIVAVPGAVAADGTSAIAVTVIARDDAGNVLSGRSVSVASSRGAVDVWNGTVGATDDTGAAAFTVRSTLPGGTTLSAVVDGVALTSGASVTFTSGAGGLLYPAGTLLKLGCASGAGPFDPCKAVYYYGSDGKRHAFPNDHIYFTWYGDFSAVQTISPSAMGQVPLGANVRYRPGVRLVKVTTIADVYELERGGVLRAIGSEAVAAALAGADWATKVDDINDAFFGDYHAGLPIASAGDYSPTAARDGTTTIDQEQGR